MEISEEHRRGIAEGLGAIAVSVAQMDSTQEQAWAGVLQMMERLQIAEADAEMIVREAAEAIASFPRPRNEPADRPGVPSADDSPAAQLRQKCAGTARAAHQRSAYSGHPSLAPGSVSPTV